MRRSQLGLANENAAEDDSRAAKSPARRMRIVLLALCALLALTAMVRQSALDREQSELEEILLQYGVGQRRPDSLAELRRETDAGHARLAVASSLLADVLDPTATDPTTAATFERRVASTRAVQELAREALDLSPLSWRARLLLGASIYLERSLDQDDRLVTRYQDWELPLEQARTMAPNEPEPQRFLSLAYLEIWPMLSAEKQTLTREMLQVAFRDRRTFQSHIDAWLAVAGDDEAALSALPDEAFVWENLRARFLRAGRWHGAAAAHRRLLRAQNRETEEFLADALARLDGGDFRNGRDRLLVLAVTLEPDRRWLSFFTKTLEQLPPGPVKLEVAARLNRWFDWNLERCLFDRCLLSQQVQERLVQLIDPDDPVVRARGLLAASNYAAAERAEPPDTKGLEDWSPYWLHKASFLIGRGNPADAAKALEWVRGSWKSSALYWHRVEQVEASLTQAQTQLDPRIDSTSREATRSKQWPSSAWGERHLLLWPAEPISGLELDFGKVTVGDVVEVIWNGGTIASLVIEPARPKATVMVEVPTEPQVLELRSLKGARPPKPAVRLLTAATLDSRSKDG